MDEPSIKEEARRLVEALPGGSTWENLVRWIYVRQAIEAGLKNNEVGRVSDVEQVRNEGGRHRVASR